MEIKKHTFSNNVNNIKYILGINLKKGMQNLYVRSTSSVCRISFNTTIFFFLSSDKLVCVPESFFQSRGCLRVGLLAPFSLLLLSLIPYLIYLFSIFFFPNLISVVPRCKLVCFLMTSLSSCLVLSFG